MSARKKPGNFVQRLHKKIRQFFNAVTKAFVNWILRSLLLLQRPSRLSQAGFVLPTVVMVLLVVILLTTAIMFRSFDRSKNASNYRVNEAVFNAAAPALDRARAKLAYLFSASENRLPGNTPKEPDIAKIFEDPKYTLGDETQLKVVDDYLTLDPNFRVLKSEKDGQITPSAPGRSSPEQLQTSWMFPVDTDNNGLFDSFTLYGLYFRNPTTNEKRQRSPLEARSIPQETGRGADCASGNAGGEAGWYPISGQLKKAFFTYVATVPITKPVTTPQNGIDPKKFEQYKGNKGFSALEMQQDQARFALDNNAVWFEDDLEVANVASLRLNGRIHTNSNLMVTNPDGYPITFYQVSSPYSCFYNAENAKIVVGGNVTAGNITSPADSTNNQVTIHLFKEPEKDFDPGDAANYRVINATNKTTTQKPTEVAYNSDAYAKRLNLLIQGALELHDASASNAQKERPTTASLKAVGRFPQELQDNFKDKCPDKAGGTDPCPDARGVLTQTLDTYFRDRTRRVPFTDIPIDKPEDILKSGGATLDVDTVFNGSPGEIAAPPDWMRIADDNGNPTNYTKLPLNFTGNTMELEATSPDPNDPKEYNIGDRVLVGNGLPARWLKAEGNPPTYAEVNEKQPVKNAGSGVFWNNQGGGASGEPRERKGLVEKLDDLGDTSRGGFWEEAAAKLPGGKLEKEDLAGGLRVITGAGIYIDNLAVGTGKREADGGKKSFLPPPPTVEELENQGITLPAPTIIPKDKLIVVWPDTMPMSQWKDNAPKDRSPSDRYTKGDLQMRATVVYHWASATPDLPIACISSYYDPTDSYTAKNPLNKPTLSNNGINYAPPTARSLSPKLRRQANMIFPDGRLVNAPLNKAIRTTPANWTLEDKAAIDAANCAFSILEGASPTPSKVPDNAIRERAFLDARQVKTLHKPNSYKNVGTPPQPDATIDIDRKTLLANIADPEQIKIPSLESFSSSPNFEYDLPIEQRQPMEIRVTEIDLKALKDVSIKANTGGAGVNNNEEFLLPNSGIIYASRDDALADSSDLDTPATDFKLDPTRRPNGIRLVNGENLARKTFDRTAEKGLILASNLPVYIKGNFNLHLSGGDTVEEFQDFKLENDANYGNFYKRKDKDKRFACRTGRDDCTAPGDQWRAARILSDAVTLLTEDFRDGYRNEGDYNLRNNAGNWAVEARLKKGFWWNSYATSAKWYDKATGFPRTDFDEDLFTNKKVGSSYVMNDVTPIQRRVAFQPYKMEICKQLLVSECDPNGPNRWDATDPSAGNTATDFSALPPAQKAEQPYPRRVAFKRNGFGQLVLDENPDPTKNYAIPLIPGGGGGTEFPYTDVTVAKLSPKPNALWFATSKFLKQPYNNVASAPEKDFEYGYDSNKPLYYLPPEQEIPTPEVPVVHERQLLLPGTPRFPDELGGILALKGQTSLNGSTLTDPSDYSVCIGNATSKLYQVTAFAGPPCPSLPRIGQMRQVLLNLKNGDGGVTAVTDFPATPPSELIASQKVNVFNLPSNGKLPIGPMLTLKRGKQSNPIFVFRTTSNSPMQLDGLNLALEGVDPNNIFWVSKTGMRLKNNSVTGNFIGGAIGKLAITDTSLEAGVRFLGFNRGGGTLGAGLTLTAMTTTDQPLLIPILQLHSPEGNPKAPFGDEHLDNKWLPRGKGATVNAAMVMGDSPARPTPSGGESGGGLQNFPRFLEAWEVDHPAGVSSNTTLYPSKINGSLIQFKRTEFATAPFEVVDDTTQDNSLFFDNEAGGSYPAYMENFGKNYRYRGGSASQKAPYYRAPERRWGYDVGLLSQTPDLFARRFSSPSAGIPNEYYREVGRDDEWITQLLCAAKPKDPTKPDGDYERAISDPKLLPKCPYDLAQYKSAT